MSRPPIANLCFSKECKEKIEDFALKWFTQKGIPKKVSPDELFCPDCGHALYRQRMKHGDTYETWYERNKHGIRRF